MRKIVTATDLKHEIRRLLDYVWKDEEADYIAHDSDGNAHIFTTIQALDAWLKGNAAKGKRKRG